MIKLMKKLWFFMFMSFFLAGCTIGSPEGETVHKLVDRFYQARQQQQDIGKIVKYYSDRRTPEEWRAHLEKISKTLGTVKSFKFKNMEVNTVFSGRTYIFDYRVDYSSGKTAAETLTVFDTVKSDDEPKIVSHVISADGFHQTM
jgi:hypothetical protein